MIPRMAAPCTTSAAAMHHFRGMGAPWHWCRTGGEGVCFMRSGCRTTNGQGVVLARRTHIDNEMAVGHSIRVGAGPNVRFLKVMAKAISAYFAEAHVPKM